MKVLVCGGRNYDNETLVCAALDELRPITRIIHGGATGADAMAKRYAWANDIPSVAYFPMWRIHGKLAGPLRNQEMLDQEKPDIVVAFEGGRGTADMVRRAQKAGIRVWFPDKD